MSQSPNAEPHGAHETPSASPAGAEMLRCIRAHLNELCGDDDDFVRELVGDYVGVFSAAITKIHGSLDAEQPDIAAAEAHSLKGASLNMGLGALGHACKELELCAKAADEVGARRALTELESAYAALTTALHDAGLG